MELTSTDESMIRNMMLSKSYRDISVVLEIPVDDISSYVDGITAGTDVITHQKRLDEIKAARPPRITRGPGKKERKRKPVIKIDKVKVEKQVKENNTRHVREHDRQLASKQREARFRKETINTDYTQLVSVRIDKKIVIYAKPGHEDEAKQKFLKNYAKYLHKG